MSTLIGISAPLVESSKWMKVVSERLNSRAISCFRSWVMGEEFGCLRRTTMARGLPEKRVSVKTSSWAYSYSTVMLNLWFWKVRDEASYIMSASNPSKLRRYPSYMTASNRKRKRPACVLSKTKTWVERGHTQHRSEDEGTSERKADCPITEMKTRLPSHCSPCLASCFLLGYLLTLPYATTKLLVVHCTFDNQ